MFVTELSDLITFLFEVVSTQNLEAKSDVIYIYYVISIKSFRFIFLRLLKENLREGVKKRKVFV